MNTNPVIDSIYDKRLEIHYNEWVIRDRDNKPVKIDLQGKIKCPLVNMQVSSLVCSKIMDKEGWPRAIDPDVCKKCNCYVYVSINRFKDKKDKPNDNRTRSPGTPVQPESKGQG